MAHSPPPKLWYLPNHCDAHQAHMHFLHKLGNAKTEANYHAYYQTLIKDGTANGATSTHTSNAYLTSPHVPFKTKCIIMKYRTGTLYNQKQVALFKLSTSQTCPLCPQVDSALHILSGCQHTQIRNTITERHNLACRMNLKAISKTGSLGSCVVSKDIGCNKQMTMQNPRFQKQLKVELFPNGSSHPASQIKTDLPPAAPILCCLLQPLQKHDINNLLQGGGFFGVAGGN